MPPESAECWAYGVIDQEFHGPWEVGGSESRSPEHFVQCEYQLQFYWPL